MYMSGCEDVDVDARIQRVQKRKSNSPKKELQAVVNNPRDQTQVLYRRSIHSSSSLCTLHAVKEMGTLRGFPCSIFANCVI